MNTRNEGATQQVSAAKSGISVRSATEIEQGRRIDPKTTARHWRTRKDPLALVWEQELQPMLTQSPQLQAITLLEYIQQHYPGKFNDGILRTLQRRVKQWRILQGPPKEVIFRQNHQPGQLGLSDFTELKGIIITIAGEPLSHKLYHFRLIYSKWSYIKVTLGGESYSALAEGLQNALQRLGGCPAQHRTDSLSAAFKNRTQQNHEDITHSYQVLCEHYSMKATRNNRGRAHENGGIESAHGHIKRRIEQALLLRASYDFDSLEHYQNFLDDVVQQHNARHAKALMVERPLLQPLPGTKTIDYISVQALVNSSSTIDVRRVTYSVPSQLQGQTLQIRLYSDRLMCYLGCDHVITLSRVYTKKNKRSRLIDYRHVIHSLVKKPQAFRYSRLRDDLFPSADYKRIWQYVDEKMSAKLACRFMVGLLHLAATQECEAELAHCVLHKIAQKHTLRLSELQEQFKRHTVNTPQVCVQQHDLNSYNDFITQQELDYV